MFSIEFLPDATYPFTILLLNQILRIRVPLRITKYAQRNLCELGIGLRRTYNMILGWMIHSRGTGVG